MRRALRGERGMTLLELMVALSIFALLAAALSPVLTGALSSRDEATARLDSDAEARAALDRLEQDLVGCFDTGATGQWPPRLVARSREQATGGSRFGARTLVELTTLVARGVTPIDGFVGGEPPRSPRRRPRRPGPGGLAHRRRRPPAAPGDQAAPRRGRGLDGRAGRGAQRERRRGPRVLGALAVARCLGLRSGRARRRTRAPGRAHHAGCRRRGRRAHRPRLDRRAAAGGERDGPERRPGAAVGRRASTRRQEEEDGE